MTLKKLHLKAKLYFILHPNLCGIICGHDCKYFKICKTDWPWKKDERYLFFDRNYYGECIKWLDDK